MFSHSSLPSYPWTWLNSLLFFSVSLCALPFVPRATSVGSLDILPVYILRIICLLTAYHNHFHIRLPFLVSLFPLTTLPCPNLQPASSPMCLFQSPLHFSNFFLSAQFPVTHLRSVSCPAAPPSTTSHKNWYTHLLFRPTQINVYMTDGLKSIILWVLEAWRCSRVI